MKTQILFALFSISLIASASYLFLNQEKGEDLSMTWPITVYHGDEMVIVAQADDYDYFTFRVASFSSTPAKFYIVFTDYEGEYRNFTTRCLTFQEEQEIDLDTRGSILNGTRSTKKIPC